MQFRGGTALFGHFVVELDLTLISQSELDGVAEWLAAYPDGPGLLLSASTLMNVGIQATHMYPETLILMHLVAELARPLRPSSVQSEQDAPVPGAEVTRGVIGRSRNLLLGRSAAPRTRCVPRPLLPGRVVSGRWSSGR